MALAVSLLPKVLRPMDGEEYFADESKGVQWKVWQSNGIYACGRFYYDSDGAVKFMRYDKH